MIHIFVERPTTSTNTPTKTHHAMKKTTLEST